MNDHGERENMHNHERSNMSLERGNMSLERSSLNMEDSGDGNLLNDGKKERADNWGTRETEALIQVWKAHYVSLESITHKRKVYKLVSDRLKELGHNRNIPAVQAKINKLKTLYRKNRPDPATGNKKPKWRFWESVHEVVLQPLQKQGIRDRIGPAGITTETGPVSPSLTDEVCEVAESGDGKPSASNHAEEANTTESPAKDKTSSRAKKGSTTQARRKLTVRHDEVLKKLLQEEDESHTIVQKLNTSYQDTVNNLVQMQKKCNEKLVSLMTTFEGHLNATQPQTSSSAPPRPLSNSSTSQSSSPYPGSMNASPHQHQQFPNRSSHSGGGLPQHFQRPQSHFPQAMSSCRPPGMLYQQQQPPPMMQPPPLPIPPTPTFGFPSWNPLSMQSETLIALLFPNMRMALHSMSSKDEVNEQNSSSVKDPDEELDADDSE